MVNPCNLKTWMGETVTQLSVVGQKNKPSRVDVEATNRKQASCPCVFLTKIQDGRATLRIFCGRDDTRRFVQYENKRPLRLAKWYAIDSDAGLPGIDPERWVGRVITVDDNTSRLHDVVACSPRANTQHREVSIQSDRRDRLFICRFVVCLGGLPRAVRLVARPFPIRGFLPHRVFPHPSLVRSPVPPSS